MQGIVPVSIGQTPVLIEIEWPDYNIPSNLGREWWLSFVEDAKSKGIKIVNAKWLDDKKPMPENPENVRSRMVATEDNWYARDTQATPPRKVFRFIVSQAATRVARTVTARAPQFLI